MKDAIIIVEGRDDTRRLKEIFGQNIHTIETNGSALSRRVIAQLQALSEDYTLIVMTDPDFQGLRLRRLIEQAIPTVLHAHITPEEAMSSNLKASLGIEHASEDAIRRALEQVQYIDAVEVELIPMNILQKYGLIGGNEASARRQEVSAHYYLGHVNGKQLQRRLAQHHISQEELQQFCIERGWHYDGV